MAISERFRTENEAAAFVLDEIVGYMYAAALRAAAATNLADHLRDGPRSVDELATLTGFAASGIHRVLRLLATKGVFTEQDPGRFGLTPPAAALCTSSPISVRAAVLMMTEPAMWRSAGEVVESTRDATPSQNGPVAAATEIPDGVTVVDVGGGHGGLLLEVLRANPSTRGVLFDQAHVLAGNRLSSAPDLADRWQQVAGNFLEDIPPADVFLIKRVLMMTVLPGHERTEGQFRELFRAADLTVESITHVRAMPVSIITLR